VLHCNQPYAGDQQKCTYKAMEFIESAVVITFGNLAEILRRVW
jgi:hypothetical protein